jgi:pimeloyl-ACP methyl ester carboxylesterase/DNA-binding CsgD family transcriptional regulator
VEQNIKFCTAPDGVNLAYAISGNGPPLVRVANWLTHLDLDWKGPIWSHWFREFTRDHTLVRFDLRGSGLSDRSVDEQSMEVWLQDLEAIIEDLGIGRFPLLGFCQGGAIALNYAVCHPEQVSHLILFDSYSRGNLNDGAPMRKKLETKALKKMIEVGWGRKDTAIFRRIFADLLMPDASEKVRHWLAELQHKTTSPAMAARLWEAFHRINVEQLAKKVEVPTLIFHVKGDKVVPFEAGRRLASLIPNARFVPLESENHILLDDDPAWERFLAEVRSFIDSEVEDSEAEHPQEIFPELTPRECEVLDLIAKGLGNDEIADRLYISPKTVRNHNTRIFSKLQVDSRSKAIVLAREAGIGKT